jgi:hypothetical protein
MDHSGSGSTRNFRTHFAVLRGALPGTAAITLTLVFLLSTKGFFWTTASGGWSMLPAAGVAAASLAGGLVAWDEWLERVHLARAPEPLAILRYGLSGSVVGERILRFHRIVAVEWPVRGGLFAFLRATLRMRPSEVRYGIDRYRCRVRLVTGGTVDLRLSGLDAEPALVVDAVRGALAEFRRTDGSPGDPRVGP